MEIEKELLDNQVIVSATDKKGIITYANKEFVEVSEYSREELLGKPHNIVRHSDMPKAIFKYVWDNLLAHKPVVAFVKNSTKDGEKFYWVKAMIYPVVQDGQIVQITSYRTKPTKEAIKQVEALYSQVRNYENIHGLSAALEFFQKYLKERFLTYDKFINRLNEGRQILNEKLLKIDVTQFKVDHILFRSAIESKVDKGEQDIEVTKPTCCAFGKQLALLEKEDFAKDGRFGQIKRIHERIHSEMQAFVNADEHMRETMLQEVHSDIDVLFEVMDDLIDHYK
jgi:PAS domain S-box-containing protein